MGHSIEHMFPIPLGVVRLLPCSCTKNIRVVFTIRASNGGRTGLLPCSCTKTQRMAGMDQRLVQLKILAASVALGEFTIPELAAYSGSNPNTVSSLVRRRRAFFEQTSDGPDRADAERAVTALGPAEASRNRRRGRPAGRWRVTDPEGIRQLVTELQANLSDAEQVTTRLEHEPQEGSFIARRAAVQVAEDSVLRTWGERDPELRRVLAQTALNNLASATPLPLRDEELEGRDWWDAVPFDRSAPGARDELALRRRAERIAILARLIDAEARGLILGSDQLARAVIALSGLKRLPSEEEIQSFVERLADSALKTTQTIGELNVFGRIVKAKSPVPVSAVVAETGLPQGTVDRFVKRLVDRRYLVPADDDEGVEPQRRITTLRVNEEQHRAIGVSVLPDKVIGGLMDLRGGSSSTVIAREFGSVSARRVDVDIVVEAIAYLVRELTQSGYEIIGLGVELPGHVSPEGDVVYSPILRQRNVPLEDRLQRITDVSDFAVILLPERGGVGSGLISGYRVLYGSKGAAGELGHLQFDQHGEICDCGKRGCLETVAGVAGIMREVRKLGRPVEKLSDAALLAEHDRDVREIFDTAGKALGWGIATLLNLLDPERVILYAPAELIDHRYAARQFTDAAAQVATRLAFSTRPGFAPVLRQLPYEPVLRPLPHEANITERAASAVMGHFIPRAHDWNPAPEGGSTRRLVAVGTGVLQQPAAAAHEA
jgi:predicted NBD/HSP70 family sugar kinase